MKKDSPILLIASLLLGSSLSLLLSKPLVAHLPIHLFSSTLPSTNPSLAFNKSFDLLDFGLTGVLTFLIYLLNLFTLHFCKLDYKKTFLNGCLYLVFSISIFLQTHFITSSTLAVLIFFAISQLIFTGLTISERSEAYQIWFTLRRSVTSTTTLDILNGIFLGFYLLLVFNQLFLLPSLSLLALFLTPVLYTSVMVFLERRFGFSERVYFPGFLLSLAVFSPLNLGFLLLLGALALGLSFALKALRFNLTKGAIIRFFYPALLVALVIYNPLFTVGGFDSVEEGFFLGWLEHLTRGQVLYKDVAVYHPPFLIWGMYLFSKVVGFSIYSERLFLHLLQIIGGVIYFFFLKRVLKNPLVITLSFLIYLATTITLVRNNVEIRVGMGLLSLIFLFNFYEGRRRLSLFLSGLAASVSCFVSIEAGLATFATALCSIAFLDKAGRKSFSNLGVFGLGFLVVTTPTLGYLWLEGALKDFIEQLRFYTGVFSQGYFNLAVDRSIVLSFFHAHIFDQYLSSTAFYFELSKLSIFGVLVYYLLKRVRSGLENQELFILTSALAGLFLSRAALGRADFYHLLFVLIIVISLIGFFIERLVGFSKLFSIVISLGLLFYIFKPGFVDQFLENQVFKFQTYGKITGNYKEYSFARGKGALYNQEDNTQDVERLVEEISKKTGPNDRIFIAPWNPEIYFYADRLNVTRVDIPFTFFSDSYQQEIIKSLNKNPAALIVYNKTMGFGDLSLESLPALKDYLEKNYRLKDQFGEYQILGRI